MTVTKGNREFTIERVDGQVLVTEGEESVAGICYDGSTVIKFPHPNPNIKNNGTALDGLSITLEQSREIGRWRAVDHERRRNEQDKKRSVPEKIRFSFGESFQLRVINKNVKYDFLNKIDTIGADWWLDNAVKTDEGTSDGCGIYEIESAVVEEHIIAREERKNKATQELEGQISYSECGECGKVRIAGWIKNGKTQVIPRAQYRTIKAAFDKAWKGQFVVDGANWKTAFEQAGYEATKINTIYCGC